jgi:hypothetical protein
VENVESFEEIQSSDSCDRKRKGTGCPQLLFIIGTLEIRKINKVLDYLEEVPIVDKEQHFKIFKARCFDLIKTSKEELNCLEYFAKRKHRKRFCTKHEN